MDTSIIATITISAIIIIVLIIFYIKTYNKLNRFSVKTDETFSGIDVALMKRYDLITNMVEVVKGYAKHEKGIIESIAKYRSDMTLREKVSAEKAMTESRHRIAMIVEKYPELKASENFQKLQSAIADVEEHLQAARRLYNANVSQYNQFIVSFPVTIVAHIHHMKKKPFFEADLTRTAPVKVKL